MKAILYAVTFLVICGAGYFTLEQSRKFEDLQKDRLTTIDTNKKVSADAAVEEKRVADEKTVLVASTQKREELDQSVSSLEATGQVLTREAADLDATLKTQSAELEELDKTMKEVIAAIGNLGEGINIDNLGQKILEVEANLKDKRTQLEELTDKIAKSEKSLADKRAEEDRFAKRQIERNRNIGRNSMEAVITAVDQDWGILIIGAGSNSGFSPQTSLLVVRDGRMIGRVRPSAIEPTQTIAEIDYKSLAPGVRLQPGDRVMLTKPNSN